ncbi:electron-transferring-flavoprotein dehydrogenase [Puccinia graminis f. sp. tritici CRL 75-36-700-3]|uniref:Electron transfer flavoprotein-ubiquinone oxidoreductase n=1 Tax=Puccinia graminis f. sp. tritici (strain CRL 75-36-700-3 / race SCCL) TaxID=418459 RepID=E3KC59_PUCGT|nr:electron-transferring-flavoprotein dehydrogenase [Puccinia graminis f. sp. tritici CRL 75-36-700-3]EFP81835.2 electron-transferring-flavoprotein dehydrogenase [Puccinia graminis f. sp. tritici CRL 75-36-700-3]
MNRTIIRTSKHASELLKRTSSRPPSIAQLGGYGARTLTSRAKVVGSRSYQPMAGRWRTYSQVTEPQEEEEKKMDMDNLERVSDEVDVCIVGGGPSGLSAAIKLRQLAIEAGKAEEFRVIVIEKGAEVGSHILSGAVIESRALDELLPEWREDGSAPIVMKASSDSMKFLTARSAFPLPHPPQMNNKGNYIVSLSKVCRWLAEQAEALGVEIYSGFAGAKLLYSDDGKAVRGVITNDIGLDRSGKPKESFEPGMEFHAKTVLLAEGCHGSLSKMAIERFKLRDGKDPQTYGLGIKEVWRVKDDVYEPGKVLHTLGWPLQRDTYGGSWMYHLEDNMVSLGLVVGLDYPNPYLSPYQEFQRLKHHPIFSKVLEGGECLAYGARALNEGGYQSIPKLTFPGGALIGCSAGFLNVPKIKGTHTAMKSGMIAAEVAFEALVTKPSESGEENRSPVELVDYQQKLDHSWVMKELKEVRNLRPSFHNPLGLYGGIIYSGIDSLLLKGRVPWTFHHKKEDHAHTKSIKEYKPIDYPPPDHKLSFDILTSVSRTGTNHAENQPNHLVIKPEKLADHLQINVSEFDGLLNKACPAGVYEYIDVEQEPIPSSDSDPPSSSSSGQKKLVINSQNCIHCKTCSIKVPTQDITWTVPEGGGGPAYSLT